MRLTPDRIHAITGLTRKSAQVKWFRLNMNVDVPCDRIGPILTETAYELLLEKRLGLGASSTSQGQRPTVKLKLAA